MQQTSISANNQAISSGLKIEHKRRILAALDLISEGTANEIANRAGIEYVACVRRLSELVTDNKVYDTGKLGKSPSNRACIIWGKVIEQAKSARA